jgi:hypothetical protein
MSFESVPRDNPTKRSMGYSTRVDARPKEGDWIEIEFENCTVYVGPEEAKTLIKNLQDSLDKQ